MSLSGASASPVSAVASPVAAEAAQAGGSNRQNAAILGRQARVPQTSAEPVVPDSRRGSDGADDTCNAFSSGGVVDLTKLVHLGKKEHWLIECTEVELQPHKILGKGGFGLVVEAKFYGASLAAKFTKEVQLIDISEISTSSNLVHELRMLRLARHPNIVQFYGACIEPGSREIVLLFEKVRAPTMMSFIEHEYQEGRADSSLLHTSDQKLVKVMIDVCRALYFLHSRSPALVHGDLKPANVFVTREGELEPHAMLADFGLAMQVRPSARPMGFTVRWAAPEVIFNALQASSTAADVFSFGRLMTYVLTGRSPLPGLQQCDITELLMRGAHLPTPNFPDSILTRSCGHIVQLCLKFNPTHRVSTCTLHRMLECLPEVIIEAYEDSGSSAGSKPRAAASQDSSMMGIVPLLPGSMEGAVSENALQTQALGVMVAVGTQTWSNALQQARDAAACDLLS